MVRWCGLALGALGLALGVSGCTNPTRVSVEFTIGTAQMPLKLVVSADQLGLPSSLEDTTSGTVATLSCSSSAQCPQPPGVTVVCDSNNECNPDPVTVSVPLGDVFDLDTIKSNLSFGTIDSFTIQSVDANVLLNTLNVDLPQAGLYWSTAGATQGENLLATMAPISKSYQGTEPVNLDATGVSSLSDYLLNTEPRAKFFVQAQVDINPGDPWPTGSITLTAVIHVQVIGSLL